MPPDEVKENRCPDRQRAKKEERSEKGHRSATWGSLLQVLPGVRVRDWRMVHRKSGATQAAPDTSGAGRRSQQENPEGRGMFLGMMND